MRTSHRSHLDHGLTADQYSYIAQVCEAEGLKGLFITTIQLPDDMGTVPCGIHGPLMGDEPVPEEEVHYVKRGSRPYQSRMCRRPERQVRQITVVGDKHYPDEFVLRTAWGGIQALQEPDDPSCRDIEASKKFWAEHALSA